MGFSIALKSVVLFSLFFRWLLSMLLLELAVNRLIEIERLKCWWSKWSRCWWFHFALNFDSISNNWTTTTATKLFQEQETNMMGCDGDDVDGDLREERSKKRRISGRRMMREEWSKPFSHLVSFFFKTWLCSESLWNRWKYVDSFFFSIAQRNECILISAYHIDTVINHLII